MQALAHPTQATHGVDLAAISAAIEPVLRAHAVVPVDVVFRMEQGGWVLRVTIEPAEAAAAPPAPPASPESAAASAANAAANLGMLTDVSRDISAVLDVADIISHRYILEVSSPGLDRPLRSARDFARFLGRTAKVQLARPTADGQRVLRGPIARVTGDSVTVEADGKPVVFPVADVGKANLVFELRPQPKSGRPKSSKYRPPEK